MTERQVPALLTVDDYTQLPVVESDRRLSYGTHPEQFGDLYLPPMAGPHPVVLLIHGGCWQSRWGLEPLGLFCAALRNEGLAIWNIEYRRLHNGGGWPATFEDAAQGSEFLHDIATEYALDLSRVIAVGHSAGGHLALWLAGRHRLPRDSPLYSPKALPLHAVVALAGIPDLIEGVRRDVCFGACLDIVGGSPEEVPDRYRVASPVELLPFGIPQQHIVGEHDPVVPPDYLRKYVAAAEQHDDVWLEELPEAGHFELILPTTHAWAVVRDTVLGQAQVG